MAPIFRLSRQKTNGGLEPAHNATFENKYPLLSLTSKPIYNMRMIILFFRANIFCCVVVVHHTLQATSVW